MKLLIILSCKEALLIRRGVQKTDIWKCFHHCDIDAERYVIASDININENTQFMYTETKFSDLLEFFKEHLWILGSSVNNLQK